MPARRVHNRTKRLRGTFKKTQALPEPVYSRADRGAPALGGLTPGQATLLRLRPKKLPWHQARHYGELVRAAPWLTPLDREPLLLYVATWAAYQTASNELARAMRDPGFADPESAAAECGKLALRAEMRHANLLIAITRQLGFSPAARAALGIDIAERPVVEKKADDPWATLRLIRSERKDEE